MKSIFENIYQRFLKNQNVTCYFNQNF